MFVTFTRMVTLLNVVSSMVTFVFVGILPTFMTIVSLSPAAADSFVALLAMYTSFSL